MNGSLFLGFVRPLFDEHAIATVFHPAVADFQEELQQVSASRTLRAMTRVRWYGAFVLLLFVTACWVAKPKRATRDRIGGDSMILLLYLPLIAGAWWCVQLFAGTAVVLGVLLACALHAWNRQHSAVLSLSIGRARPLAEPALEPIAA